MTAHEHHCETTAEATPPEAAAASAKARPQGAALNRHPVPEWVHEQMYLHPYPKELMLRNHV